MIFTRVSESVDILLLRHVLRISGRYVCLVSNRAWEWTMKGEVVFSPSLHSGHVSVRLLPAAVADVEKG